MDDAEFVKACRNHLGLSQNEFAELLGKKNNRTIRKWESGGEVQRTDLIAMALLVDFKNDPEDDINERNFLFYDFYLECLFIRTEENIQKLYKIHLGIFLPTPLIPS